MLSSLHPAASIGALSFVFCPLALRWEWHKTFLSERQAVSWTEWLGRWGYFWTGLSACPGAQDKWVKASARPRAAFLGILLRNMERIILWMKNTLDHSLRLSSGIREPGSWWPCFRTSSRWMSFDHREACSRSSLRKAVAREPSQWIPVFSSSRMSAPHRWVGGSLPCPWERWPQVLYAVASVNVEQGSSCRTAICTTCQEHFYSGNEADLYVRCGYRSTYLLTIQSAWQSTPSPG